MAEAAVAVALGFVADDGELLALFLAEIGRGDFAASCRCADFSLCAIVSHQHAVKGDFVALFMVAEELNLKHIAFVDDILLAAG